MEKFKNLLNDVVEQIKQDPSVLSISIIGSGARKLDALEQVYDIDLFVVKDDGEGFEREVKDIEGKEFDISYIDVEDLNKLIIKDNHFWLNILSKARHLYKRNSLIDGYFQLANRLYINGPTLLSDSEVVYIRFKTTKQVEDLSRRLNDATQFQYLANVYLTDMLRAYFRLQNTWIPRDKRMMDYIFNVDLVLYELVKGIYRAENTQDHLRLIDDIALYILKPYGGKISYLERCKLPIYE